jgi:hypothetical protein
LFEVKGGAVMQAVASRSALWAFLLMGSVGLAAGAGSAEQSPKTAAGLVNLMKSRGLSTVAATDPQNPGRVVAAMLIPDVQLLVVGAKSTAGPYLESQIAKGQYTDVYAVLNSTAVPDTKIFFQDMRCDGLTNDNDGIDVMYERGTAQTIFDGDWKRQKISKQDYDNKLQKADAEYNRMLTLLAERLQATTASPGR